MLSRVASSLYWTGRYIERSDFLGRFLSINYFSSLDSPNSISQSRRFVLESMLYMWGADFDGPFEEDKILHHLGFDQSNPNSIINNVTRARQNAHGTRHLISEETWEAINKCYHFVNGYPVHVFIRTGLYDLTTKLNESCSIIREKIIRTLLHDEVWALIMLGIHTERAFQMVRLINTKMYDLRKISGEHSKGLDFAHEWATLLRCAEAYDMSKKHYRKIPNEIKTLEFLILNSKNPKSLISNINKIQRYIDQVSNKTNITPDMVEFKVGKLAAYFSYLTIDEIVEDITKFLVTTYDQLADIGNSFQAEYLFFTSGNGNEDQEEL